MYSFLPLLLLLLLILVSDWCITSQTITTKSETLIIATWQHS